MLLWHHTFVKSLTVATTQIFVDSLGGTSKTPMFVNCHCKSPTGATNQIFLDSLGDTSKTLMFVNCSLANLCSGQEDHKIVLQA